MSTTLAQSWRQEERMDKNVHEGGEQACPMTCLIKDHKGWTYSEDTPIPPSRPVVAGNIGVNRCMSELTSLIIEPISMNMESHAIDSTGDMLHLIENLNGTGEIEKLIKEKTIKQVPEHGDLTNESNKHSLNGDIVESIKKRIKTLESSCVRGTSIPDLKQRLIAVGLLDRVMGTNKPFKLPTNKNNKTDLKDAPPVQEEGFVVVGSDVEKLFPSLRPLDAARLTRLAVLQSDVKIDNIDPIMGLRYLYIVGGKELIERSGLIRLCPRWLGNRDDLITLGGKKSNNNINWRDTKNEIFDGDVKKIAAAVLECCIIITMCSHLYMFNGILYLQCVGGAIGLRLTAALANLVMAFYDQALEELLSREGISLNLKFRFVDDGRLGLRPVRAGWRWYNGGMMYKKEWVAEDLNLSQQERTKKAIHGALNSICEYLVFTTEDGLDYEDGKLPTLDCKIWVEGSKILYSFYEKPQVPNRTLQEGTALSRTSLESSLIQEGVRRLLNTSPDVDELTRSSIIDRFASKLYNSGHDVYTVQKLLIHAVYCYQDRVRRSKLQNEHPEYKPLYLSKNFNKENRILEKSGAKTEWYLGKKNVPGSNWKMDIPKCWRPKKIRQRAIAGIETTTVMTVPNSPESKLLNNLILKEAQLSRITGYSIKLVEGNGTPLSRILPKPLTMKKCLVSDKCEVCLRTEGISKCSARNVLYIAECQEKGRTSSDDNLHEQKTTSKNVQQPSGCEDFIYVGETSRSLKERSSEHISGGRRLEINNFITKHWLNSHPDSNVAPIFKFSVVRIHRDALSREVDEGLSIEKAEALLNVLNSKSEWGSGKLSRLSVEKSSWELKKQAKELNETEEISNGCLRKFQNEKKSKVSFEKAFAKQLYRAPSRPPCSKTTVSVNGADIRNYFTRATIHTSSEESSEAVTDEPSSVVKCLVNNHPSGENLDLNCFRFLQNSTGGGDPASKRRRLNVYSVDENDHPADTDHYPATDHLLQMEPKVLFGTKPIDSKTVKQAVNCARVMQCGGFIGTLKPPIKCGDSGLLWRMRDLIELNDWGVESNELENITALDIDELFNSSFDDNYKKTLSRDEQNQIVARLSRLQLEEAGYPQSQWDIDDDNVPTEIMRYLKLVSEKLDENVIPNLYRNNDLNPMSNWLANLVLNHKMRSTFDFEAAVNRELGDNNNGKLVWDFKLMDTIGGKGTTTDTVFELKKLGSVRGLKRPFICSRKRVDIGSKIPKLDDLIGGISDLTINYQVSDSSPVLKLKIKKDEDGNIIAESGGMNDSHVNSQKRNMPVPVKIVSKPVKLGRVSPKKSVKEEKTYQYGVCVDDNITKTPQRTKKSQAASHSMTPESILRYVIRTPRRKGGFNSLPLGGRYVDGRDQFIREADGSAVESQQLNPGKLKCASQALDPKQEMSQD